MYNPRFILNFYLPILHKFCNKKIYTRKFDFYIILYTSRVFGDYKINFVYAATSCIDSLIRIFH